jgi:hypothetical protein
MRLFCERIKNIYILVFFYLILKTTFKIKPKVKSIIPISFATDNKFAYPLIVLLTSILYNSRSITFYYFYIMVPNEFFKENKQKITALCKKYKKCEIIFLNMGEKYKDWKTSNHYSAAVYYRLSLSDKIKDLDKIIYLDCDTMVHNDLSNLYNIELGDKYYMGFPAHEISYLVINGTRNYINSGVMLINLKLLRRIKASLIFDKYFYTYGTKKVDEYLINVIFYNKISFLPFEYGIPDFEKNRTIIGSPSLFWKSLKGYSNGTEEDMILASNNRVITHGSYRLDKWWKRSFDSLSSIGKKWIFYASKSNVFNEICNTFIQYQIVCSNFK